MKLDSGQFFCISVTPIHYSSVWLLERPPPITGLIYSIIKQQQQLGIMQWILDPVPRLHIPYHLAVMSCVHDLLHIHNFKPLPTIVWLPEPNNYSLPIYDSLFEYLVVVTYTAHQNVIWICVCVCLPIHAANLLLVGLVIQQRGLARCGVANNRDRVPHPATGSRCILFMHCIHNMLMLNRWRSLHFCYYLWPILAIGSTWPE